MKTSEVILSILHSALIVAFIGLVVYAAWSDARQLRIPNWVSIALLGLFFPTAVLSAIGLESIAWHVATAVGLLIFGFGLFAFGVFGGGDAKLMAAIGLWMGLDLVLPFVFWTVIVGGVLSVLVILLRKGLGMWPGWLVKSAQGVFEPGKAVPYGIAITAGALITLPHMDVLPPAWADVFNIIAG